MNDKWYEKSGDWGDIVISTRIRLARNLSEYPFPNRMNASQRRECEDKIKEIARMTGFENMSYFSRTYTKLPQVMI